MYAKALNILKTIVGPKRFQNARDVYQDNGAISQLVAYLIVNQPEVKLEAIQLVEAAFPEFTKASKDLSNATTVEGFVSYVRNLPPYLRNTVALGIVAGGISLVFWPARNKAVTPDTHEFAPSTFGQYHAIFEREADPNGVSL